ncbi:hypothetical protein ACGFIY_21045 [Micromonospora chersina]|uniref:hypothetical protein n=1 Tax=Micromonospora chersina TaxID=47854 RepID=UPI00371CE646
MITLIVELSCDHDGCDLAYAPAVDELTDISATRKGATEAGWIHRDGKDYCPGHNPDAALIAVVKGLVAKGRNDSEIAVGLEWPRWKVQQFRAKHGIKAGVTPGRPARRRTQPRQEVSVS